MVYNKSFSEYKYSKISKDAETDIIYDSTGKDPQDGGYFVSFLVRTSDCYDFHARSDTPDSTSIMHGHFIAFSFTLRILCCG